MPTTGPLRRALVAASATALALTACGGGDEGGGSDPGAAGNGAPSDAAVEEVDLSGVTLRVADQLGGLEVPLRISGQLDDVPYEIEWNTAAEDDGAVSLTAQASDACGNETTSDAVEVTIDNTPIAVDSMCQRTGVPA